MLANISHHKLLDIQDSDIQYLEDLLSVERVCFIA